MGPTGPEQSKRRNEAVRNLDAVEMKAVLLDSLPECAFLVGEDQKILTTNTRVQTMLGGSPDSVIGQPVAEVLKSLTHEDGSPVDISTAVTQTLSTGEAEMFEAMLACDSADTGKRSAADPKPVTVTVAPARPLQEGRKKSPAVVIVVSGEAVTQPYGLRDAVLSMVSHELRTPLLHIKGFVSSLLESDIEWDEETRLDFLHTIDREADRLTSMVTDLMEITRMGSGDLPLHLEYADPYMLSYAALDSASPFTHRHQVVVQVPEGLPKINIDSLRVMGVLVNLIENATKYTPEGSKILIDAKADDDNVTFSVADRGPGMPANVQSQIFKMFYRGEVDGKRSSGTGLGLAVCKAVMEAHNGEIWVESQEGKGSTFKFRIPLNAAMEGRGSNSRTARAVSAARTSRSRPAGKKGIKSNRGRVTNPRRTDTADNRVAIRK